MTSPAGTPDDPLLRPSPNHGARRGGGDVDMVILHYTGMASAGAALDRLCDPDTEVSAHWLIAEDGAVHALVAEDRRAWHAGRAYWAGVEDVNSRSVGIELANPGTGPAAHPFPEPQMAALEALLAGIRARHGVPAERVLGHACVAPGRKIDPGPRFDWRRLARSGHAVWPWAAEAGPAVAPAEETPATARAFRAAARRMGYGLPAEGGWDDAARSVWDAFAERFAPRLAGRPGAAPGLARLEALAARWPGA